jgi:hypothetical protein
MKLPRRNFLHLAAAAAALPAVPRIAKAQAYPSIIDASGRSRALIGDISMCGATARVRTAKSHRGHRKHSRDLPIGLFATDRAMEAWYRPSIA